MTHSRAFDGLVGDFPIGFLVWDTGVNEPIHSIETTVFDRDGLLLGKRSFYSEVDQLPLSLWIRRPRSNGVPSLPLKNALEPATVTKDLRGSRSADGAIGSMLANSNSPQNANKLTALFSSGFGSAGAYFITADNLERSAITFSVRRLIKATWLNDRDQFLQPSTELSETFKADCLIWMLFNGSNLTAGADGLIWNGRSWSLTNHFIPFSEDEVGAYGRFESTFMAQYIKKISPSVEALNVLNQGRALWQRFHGTQFSHSIRQRYKLNRPDAGWYQVRRALEENQDNQITDFEPFKESYAELSRKLWPLVFEYGFLRM